jgi:hypothetical protein
MRWPQWPIEPQIHGLCAVHAASIRRIVVRNCRYRRAQGASTDDSIYSPRGVGLSIVSESVKRAVPTKNSNMKAENSNSCEAAALARVADPAREVQAASAAIGAHFNAVGKRQASTLELARLTAAVQELEDARLALAVVIDDGNR